MNCSCCDKQIETKPTKHGERLPKGWKRRPDDGLPLCGKCWGARYILRAITIPVVRPLGEGVGWPQLREALTKSWSESTSATNWIMTELFVNDSQRTPDMEKLPKMERQYLYPRTRERYPGMPSQAAAALENAIQAKYAKKRYEVLWTCASSLPNARYPQPAIAPNQGWTPSYEPAGKESGDKVPCVSVRLGQQRWLLQLKGGKEFRRQLASFRQLVSGQAVQGELAILRQRIGAKNGNGVQARDGGGQQFATRVMVKMVGWFPRQPARQLEGTLYVRSDTDSFLIALDEKGNKIRLWNADHVRRWLAEHSRRLQRWSDDQKAEQRPHASFQSRREKSVDKQKKRMGSFIQETAAQIAGVALRQRYAAVRLDDSERSYFGAGRFNWSRFETYLMQRLDADGITLELASGEVAPETLGPLAETQTNDS